MFIMMVPGNCLVLSILFGPASPTQVLTHTPSLLQNQDYSKLKTRPSYALQEERGGRDGQEATITRQRTRHVVWQRLHHQEWTSSSLVLTCKTW